MKSFFKKLSLVLAAAMIITMIPATGVKAANLVAIGFDKATAGTEIVLDEIGDTTAKLKFYGATGYAAAKDAKTKDWKSSDEKVATVENGVVTAVGYGSANISLTVTVSATGLSYAGSVKVTVKEPVVVTATPEASIEWAKQTAYNTVTITFKDKAAAEKADIDVKRVKLTTTDKEYLLDVKSTNTVENNTVKISGLTDSVTYRFTVSSLGETDITMHAGDPAMIVLSYGDVTIGTDKDITGSGNKSATVTPEVKIYDENGVALSFNAKDLKYSTDKTQNKSVTFSTTGGKIKYNSVDSKCYVKVTYTFTANGTKDTIEDTGVFSPSAYVTPSLGGFVEQIVLTTVTDKSKVAFATDCTYEGTMNVGETKNVAYYFLGSDNNKYVGKDSYLEGGKDYRTLNSTNYKLYLVIDDKDSNVLSLEGNKVVALSEGNERICLYQQVGSSRNEVSDILYGVIDITVDEQSYPYEIKMTSNDTDLAGTSNTLIESLKKAEITFKVNDQYGKGFANTGFRVYKVNDDGTLDTNNELKGVTPSGKTDKDGKATIDITYSTVAGEAKKLDTTTYQIVLDKNKDEVAEFTITVDEIPAATENNTEYEVEVNANNVSNKALYNSDEADKVGSTIKVARLIDGYKYDYVDFNVIGDDDLTATEEHLSKSENSTQAKNMLGKRFVVITDSDGNTVSETKGETITAAANLSESDILSQNKTVSQVTLASGAVVTYYELGTTNEKTVVYLDGCDKTKVEELTKLGGDYYKAASTSVASDLKGVTYVLSSDSKKFIAVDKVDATTMAGVQYYVKTEGAPTLVKDACYQVYAVTGASKNLVVGKVEATCSDGWNENGTPKVDDATWKFVPAKDDFEVTALEADEAKMYFNGAKYDSKYDGLTFVGSLEENWAKIANCKIVSVDNTKSAAVAAYLFDTYADGSGLQILTGDYTASLYVLEQVNSGYSFDQEASQDFTVANNVAGLQNIAYTKLKVDNNKAVKDGDAYTWTKGYPGGTDYEKDVKPAVQKIAESFYAWYDMNADSKASNDEVKPISTLMEKLEATFTVDDCSAVIGADGKSLYIKSIDYTITFAETGTTITGTYEPKTLFK